MFQHHRISHDKPVHVAVPLGWQVRGDKGKGKYEDLDI
jgi:hypothetical protein